MFLHMSVSHCVHRGDESEHAPTYTPSRSHLHFLKSPTPSEVTYNPPEIPTSPRNQIHSPEVTYTLSPEGIYTA